MTAIALPPSLESWAAAVGGVLARDVYAMSMVDVDSHRWHEAIASARDEAHLVRLEFIAAVDEADDSFTVIAHLLGGPLANASHQSRGVDSSVNGEPDLLSLFVRTTFPHDTALDSITDLFPGAAWHEREMAEMFGVVFSSGAPDPLLLSPTMPEHPMLKSFWLAPRQDRAWPGAKEPGESDADAAVESAGDHARPRRGRRRQSTFGVRPPETGSDRP